MPAARPCPQPRSLLRTAAHPVHHEPKGQMMRCTELVASLTIKLLGESRQGRGGDVIQPDPVKDLHYLLTGVSHGDHPTYRFWLRPWSARSACPLKPVVGAKASQHKLRQRSLTDF